MVRVAPFFDSRCRTAQSEKKLNKSGIEAKWYRIELEQEWK